MSAIFRLLRLMVPCWCVISFLVYLIWGPLYFQIQTFAFLGCLTGGVAAESVQNLVVRSKTKLAGAAFLAGAVPRTIFPVFFLLFSLNYYQYPIDKNLQYVIIDSYFAYYPLMLYVCASSAIARAKSLKPGNDSQEESPKDENPAGTQAPECATEAIDEDQR